MNKLARPYGAKESLWATLSLFGSLGTLVCCALPALLVSLGAGAALAGLVSSAPWLVALSRYKIWTFGIAGLLLIGAGWMQWHSRNMPCPADPLKARACQRLRVFNLWLYGFSVVVYLVGFFFAFVAVEIFY